MIEQKTIIYYKSWLYERKRAIKFGKTNYCANCTKEIDRLEKTYPELKGVKAAYETDINNGKITLK